LIFTQGTQAYFFHRIPKNHDTPTQAGQDIAPTPSQPWQNADPLPSSFAKYLNPTGKKVKFPESTLPLPSQYGQVNIFLSLQIEHVLLFILIAPSLKQLNKVGPFFADILTKTYAP
jgi:hypothetical protein